MKKITVWTSSTCGACKMLKVELAKLESEVDVNYISIDESESNRKLAKESGVTSLPSISYGDKRVEGFLPASEVLDFIK